MRVINVVVTNKNGVQSIDSFGIFEEQLGQDVIDKAEKHFIHKIKSNNIECEDETDEENYLGNGYADHDNGIIVAIVWSNI